MRLAGKVAFIGGAGTKMGRAVPLLFAQEGAKVVVAARTQDTLAETVRLIEAAGGEAIACAGDMTDESFAKAAIGKAIERFGRLDVLYSNAGGFAPHSSDIADMDVEFWDQATRNNLRSTFLTCKAAIPELERAGGGSIITVAAAYQTRQSGNGAYAAAKQGLIGYTKNLARELWPKNIRVNCVAPGFMRLPLADGAVKPAALTLDRRGAPEDAAFAALYFASDESAWVTGQILEIDGGDAVTYKQP